MLRATRRQAELFLPYSVNRIPLPGGSKSPSPLYHPCCCVGSPPGRVQRSADRQGLVTPTPFLGRRRWGVLESEGVRSNFYSKDKNNGITRRRYKKQGAQNGMYGVTWVIFTHFTRPFCFACFEGRAKVHPLAPSL